MGERSIWHEYPNCQDDFQQGLRRMAHTNFLADLLSASGDAVYDWDLGADHIEWLGAWGRIFSDAHPPPVNSRDFYNVICDDDRHLVFGAETRVIDREYRLRRPDGRLV